MRIYLHIGYPKTATTWLQKKLFPFVKNFAFVERNDIMDELINPYALKFNPKKARKFFLEKYGDHLILSLEGFLGTNFSFGLNGYLTKEHAQRLQSTFPEAKIIVFIRRQQDIIASSYSQYIVGGGTYSINHYLKNHSEISLSRISLFSYQYYEYHYSIRLYRELFSAENVGIYLYEDFKHDNKSFMNRFLKENNFEINQESFDFGKETERYRKGLIKLSFLANLFTSEKMLNKYYIFHFPYWFRLYKPILKRWNRYKIFGKRPGTLQILGKKNNAQLSEYYRDSNQLLVDEFGLKSIIKHNYPL